MTSRSSSNISLDARNPAKLKSKRRIIVAKMALDKKKPKYERIIS